MEEPFEGTAYVNNGQFFLSRDGMGMKLIDNYWPGIGSSRRSFLHDILVLLRRHAPYSSFRSDILDRYPGFNIHESLDSSPPHLNVTHYMEYVNHPCTSPPLSLHVLCSLVQ